MFHMLTINSQGVTLGSLLCDLLKITLLCAFWSERDDVNDL